MIAMIKYDDVNDDVNGLYIHNSIFVIRHSSFIINHTSFIFYSFNNPQVSSILIFCEASSESESFSTCIFFFSELQVIQTEVSDEFQKVLGRFHEEFH